MAATDTVSVLNAPAGTNALISGRGLFWIVLVVSSLIYAQSEFWKLPSAGDRANWDYFAQVISRGGVPYRDVVNIKSPLSAYIGAAAIVVTRPFGLRDVLATRIAFMLLPRSRLRLPSWWPSTIWETGASLCSPR
ncbi:MAG TPA: hypothetical protein VNS63_26635 [Blastocatellia bacterium]|nr:hypothetical protein [Blastocatellia bacterium]